MIPKPRQPDATKIEHHIRDYFSDTYPLSEITQYHDNQRQIYIIDINWRIKGHRETGTISITKEAIADCELGDILNEGLRQCEDDLMHKHAARFGKRAWVDTDYGFAICCGGGRELLASFDPDRFSSASYEKRQELLKYIHEKTWRHSCDE